MAASDVSQSTGEPAQSAQEGLSLSGVVLQAEGPLRGQRMLRALVVMLCLLALTEGLLRLWLGPDERVLRDPLHPYGCYHEDELARLVAARRRGADAVDVVLLGDSVLSSVVNQPGETVRDYLEAALAQRLEVRAGVGVRVWNLGRGGSHAADLYAALLQLLHALDEVPASTPGRPLLLVMNSNHIFFSRRHAVPSMLYPCLGPALADDYESIALLRPPPPPGRLEQALTGWVTRHVYLYQQRRQVSERLFGGPPRDAVRDHLQEWFTRLRSGHKAPEIGERDRNLPWSERGLSAAQFAPSYQFLPLESPEAVNYQMTQRLAALLARHPELTPLVFLTPQNHGLLGALADSPQYRQVAAAIVDTFAKAGVRVRSYDNLVPDRLFLDIDHLSADGNRRLAALLEQDLAPLLPR